MQRKLAVTLCVIMLALVSLCFKIWNIVSENSEEYRKIVLSDRQENYNAYSYNSKTILFKRGDITDRNGNVLAESQKVYDLILDPVAIYENDGINVEKTVKALNEQFGDDPALKTTLLEKKNAGRRYILYKKGISYDDKTGLEAKIKDKYPEITDPVSGRIHGIDFTEKFKRIYPYGQLACNILGFSDNEGTNPNGGVEKYYNEYLVGTNGREYGYFNSDTRIQSVLRDAEDGNNIVTTINLNIQTSIEKYLREWQTGDIGSKMAAAIVMDPKNGEVLGLASTNSFDPNSPRDIDPERYPEEELVRLGRKEAVRSYQKENPGKKISEEETDNIYSRDELISFGSQAAWNEMWKNICVTDTYEPGSTVKPFTIAAALEENAITRYTTFDCQGYIELSDGVHTWKIRCHNHNGDGILDAENALMRSCNVYLMETAFRIGGENFSKYQHIFGFGEKTGIDLPAETPGLLYSEESLGRTALATNSFGQNFNVTMIQMAAGFSSLINGGNYYRPHVLKRMVDPYGITVKEARPECLRTTVSKETSDFLKEALYRTVEEGTGVKAQIEGYHVGGKTGTAEKLPRTAKNYLVSFCGFVPAENPELLVYVIVDTPNLVGEAQASAGFAIGIEKKIMEDCVKYLNIRPIGAESSEITESKETTESKATTESKEAAESPSKETEENSESPSLGETTATDPAFSEGSKKAESSKQTENANAAESSKQTENAKKAESKKAESKKAEESKKSSEETIKTQETEPEPTDGFESDIIDELPAAEFLLEASEEGNSNVF